MRTFTLNNGRELPYLAYGTWKLPNNEETIDIVSKAIKNGYRYIDTASAYLNEEYIGKGIKDSNIKRDELYIAGKLWNEDRGYDNIINACKKTINNLGCEYLDVYLIHWPASPAVYENWEEINNETWKAFEYLYEVGLVKAIGICNFKVRQLKSLLRSCKVKPMVNQIEFHPGFMQKDILEFCKENNILVEAWSPLGSGKMLKKEELKSIATKYNKDVAQICIKWCLQNNVLPISKTKNIERMITNQEIDDFEISKEDMEYLNSLPYLGGSGLDSETITIFN